MWLRRCLNLFGDDPVMLVGSVAAGSHTLIGALEKPDVPLVWLDLTPEDAENPHVQARKLSDAVNAKLGQGLLPEGSSAEAALGSLANALCYLTPLTLAFSGAQHAPELAARMLELHGSGCCIVLHAELPIPALPVQLITVQTITVELLRLEHSEARALADGRLPDAVVHALCEKSGGLYESFMTLLHQTLLLPSHLTPSPTGPRLLLDPGLEPGALLNLLIKKGRWLEALEVAVFWVPERVPEVLAVAGHHYHAEGLHERLHVLLESLPEEVQTYETVRFWRFQAAFRLGRSDAVLRETEAYLAEHEAPELRAAYAGAGLPYELALAHAARAYHEKQTALTVFQLGRLTDAPEAIGLLEASFQLAEKDGYPYEIVRNAGALAAKLIWHGRYQEAVDWGAWALRELERCGVKDVQQRLRIVNDWVYARLLTGETAGLEVLLRECEIYLATAYPALARLFRDTLGDYLTAHARPAEALHYYRLNFETSPRDRFAEAALKMVRGQLELGQLAEALATAKQALHATKDASAEAQAPAQLAYGMVLALTQPVAARAPLARARRSFTETYNAFWAAQAALYLAGTYVLAGDPSAVRAVLAEFYEVLRQLPLSALRLLSGPEEVFRPVWALWLGEGAPLELRFLGGKEVWWQGKKLELFPQWLEILTVLALKARSLTLEELLAELYGDGGNKNTLKASISKLRRVLPVSAHPYRLTAPVQADFLDVSVQLGRGELQGALRRYRGPLLPGSEVSCIREYDEVLVEGLRRAALGSDDLESLLHLSDVFPDDRELLEAVRDLLPPGDPRMLLLEARLEQVQRDW